MKKSTLYIGLNDKDSKQQKIDTLEATKMCINILTASGIDGATVYNAMGIYKHDNGDIIVENTLRIELIEADESALKTAINSIKIVLNQESIILQNEVIKSVML